MKEKYISYDEKLITNVVRGIGSRASAENLPGVSQAKGTDTPQSSKAACTREDPELFFPEGRGWAFRQQVEDAKAVCRSCEIKSRCLNHALVNGEPFGIWGGLTENERRALIRRASTR